MPHTASKTSAEIPTPRNSTYPMDIGPTYEILYQITRRGWLRLVNARGIAPMGGPPGIRLPCWAARKRGERHTAGGSGSSARNSYLPLSSFGDLAASSPGGALNMASTFGKSEIIRDRAKRAKRNPIPV